MKGIAWLRAKRIRILYIYVGAVCFLFCILYYAAWAACVKSELKMINAEMDFNIGQSQAQYVNGCQMILLTDCDPSSGKISMPQNDMAESENYPYFQEAVQTFHPEQQVFHFNAEEAEYLRLYGVNLNVSSLPSATDQIRQFLKTVRQSENTVYIQKQDSEKILIAVSESHPFRKAVSQMFRLHILILFLCAYIYPLSRLRRYLRIQKKEVDALRKDSMNAIAHQIRTPLSAMIGYAENIEMNVCPEKNSYYLEQIKKKGNEINEMINRILRIGRLEDDEIVLTQETVSCTELLQECMRLYDRNIFSTEIKRDWILMADREYIKNMFLCLIDNAVRYRTDHSPVKITVNHDSVSIYNDCDKSCLEALREADGFRFQKDGHCSFGLYYAKKICEKSGLHLEITEEENGIAATVSAYC